MFWFFENLAIFYCVMDIVDFTLLLSGFSCISLASIKLYSGLLLSTYNPLDLLNLGLNFVRTLKKKPLV